MADYAQPGAFDATVTIVGMGTLHKAAYLTVMYFSKRKLEICDTEQDALAWIGKQE